MSYGIELYNTDGVILFGPEEKQYGYYGKTVDGVGSVPTGTYLSFDHWTTTYFPTAGTELPSGVHTVYYFVPFSTLTNSDAYGLEIYDSSGSIVWHSGAPPLILWADDTGTTKPAITPLTVYVEGTIGGGILTFDLSRADTLYAIGTSVATLQDIDDEASVSTSYFWNDPSTAVPVVDGAFYDNY